MVVFSVDEANLVIHIVHIAVVIVKEDHIVNRLARGGIGQIDQPFGFPGAFFAGDYLYHGNNLLMGITGVIIAHFPPLRNTIFRRGRRVGERRRGEGSAFPRRRMTEMGGGVPAPERDSGGCSFSGK